MYHEILHRNRPPAVHPLAVARPLFSMKGDEATAREIAVRAGGGSVLDARFARSKKVAALSSAHANQTVHCPATAYAGLGDSGLCAPPLPFGQGKGRNLVVIRFCMALHIIARGTQLRLKR